MLGIGDITRPTANVLNTVFLKSANCIVHSWVERWYQKHNLPLSHLIKMYPKRWTIEFRNFVLCKGQLECNLNCNKRACQVLALCSRKSPDNNIISIFHIWNLAILMNGSVCVQFLRSSNYVDTDAPSCTCVGNSLFKFKLQWHQIPSKSKRNEKRSGNGISFYFLKAKLQHFYCAQ